MEVVGERTRKKTQEAKAGGSSKDKDEDERRGIKPR